MTMVPSTTTRSALGAALMLSSCQIDQGDVPKFGGPCSNGCDTGFICDSDLDACVPDPGEGEGEGPLAGRIISFTVTPDDVAPGEEVTFTLESTNTRDCNISPGVGAIEPNGFVLTTMNDGAGDFTFDLACTGDDGGVVDADPVTVHVRFVVEGSLVLASQADVDAVEGVEEVNGDVLAVAATIGDVAALGSLRIVRGDILIDAVTGLASLSLPALTTVEGDVRVMEPDDTLSAVSLPALTSIGGNFEVLGGNGVNAVSAQELLTVGGNLVIGGYEYPDFPSLDSVQGGGLPALTNLGLAKLATVGGFIDIEDDVNLPSVVLPSLELVGGTIVVFGARSATVASFPVLASVGGAIIFERNAALATVSMPSLTTMGDAQDALTQLYEEFSNQNVYPGFFAPGDLRFVANHPTTDDFDDNRSITALDFSALTTVAGRLMFTFMSVTEPSFDLSNLQTVGGLYLAPSVVESLTFNLTSLTSVGAGGLFLPYPDDAVVGLQLLARVDGDFALESLDLPDLPALKVIGGRFEVGDLGSPALLPKFAGVEDVGILSLGESGVTSFAALASLQRIGGLRVNTTAMTSLGLDGVTEIYGIPGDPVAVSIASNNLLTDASFPALTGTVGGDIRITASNAVSSVNLGQVITIDGTLVLDGDAIDDFRACNLSVIQGQLQVNDTLLSSLDGLGALTTVGGLVSVTGNTSLPACHVDVLAAQLGEPVTNSGNTAPNPDPCTDLGLQVCP